MSSNRAKKNNRALEWAVLYPGNEEKQLFRCGKAALIMLPAVLITMEQTPKPEMVPLTSDTSA